MTDTTDTTTQNENEQAEVAPVEEQAPEEQAPEEQAAPEVDGAETEKEEDDGLVVKVEEVSEVERRIDVEVPWVEVKSKMDEAYQGLSKGLQIKGFRKGKVPRRMVEQLFGKHIQREVVQLLVQESIDRAVQRVELKVVGEPKLDLPEDGVKQDESFCYSATFEVVVDLEIKDYMGVEVTGYTSPVSDEDVEASLASKQRELTDYKSVEDRETRAGDVLLLDIMGKMGDEPLDLQKRTMDLSDDTPELLPGLKEKLIGLPSDQEDVSLELDIPGAAEGEPATKARLLVTIQDVKEKVVPELDDDLAKDTGEAQTLDELRQVLRKKLEDQEQERATDAAKKQMVSQIIEANHVPVAPALVERYVEQRLQLQRLMSGRPADQASPEDELLKEQLRPEAMEVVQSGLVLEAISKQEKLDVSDEDLDAEMEKMAEQREVNVARVRSEYEKEGRLESLRRRLVEDKTLDLIASKGKIIIEEKTEEAPDNTEAETE